MAKARSSGSFCASRADRALLRIVLPLLPGHFYYIIIGLVPIVSLGSLGAAHDVAGFWALSRLGMVLQTIKPVITLVGHPYVSRGADRGFGPRSREVVGAVLLLGFLATLSGMLFPRSWLLLLGSNYAHLIAFVPLALVLPSLNILSETIYTMIVASGETRWCYLSVVVGLLTQFLVYTINPIADLASAYVFAISVATATLMAQVALYRHSLIILRRRGARP